MVYTHQIDFLPTVGRFLPSLSLTEAKVPSFPTYTNDIQLASREKFKLRKSFAKQNLCLMDAGLASGRRPKLIVQSVNNVENVAPELSEAEVLVFTTLSTGCMPIYSELVELTGKKNRSSVEWRIIRL